jgi:aspartyl aminopeptidase
MSYHENEPLTRFVQFLDCSPTVWHTAHQIGNRLAEADFVPLQEDERWKLEPGKSYFVMRDEAALCAFRLPKKIVQHAILLASHFDSPALKVKPISLIRQRPFRLMTEAYGSPLLHTWLDRDLYLAGRVMIRNNIGKIVSKLVLLDAYPLVIPSLAPHLDRTLDDKGLIVNKQDHLQPIASLEEDYNLEALLSQAVSSQEILAWDLFLVPLEKARFSGMSGELLSSYRLDNLTSVFASLQALLESSSTQHCLQLTIFWDHEEIGSHTFLGARSAFVDQILERICVHQRGDREDFFRIKNRSFCLSIDVAHGYHPNFADRFDPLNTPHLGNGVVIKMSAMQTYATNAATSAPLFSLAKQNGWSLQHYAARSDRTSGITVGSMMASGLGIPTVDLGIATWAMHSIRETMAASDEIALIDFLKATLAEEELFASKSECTRPF